MRLKNLAYIGIVLFVTTCGIIWSLSRGRAGAEEKSLQTTIPEKIRSYLSSPQLRDIGVYYYNLDSKEEFGYNDTHSFTPASLMKLGIMITYYKQAEDIPETLSQKMVYSGHNGAVEENDVVQPLTTGKSYTVDELIKRMILYSDNDAMFLLLTPFIDVEMKKTYGDLGLSDTDINNSNFVLTPSDIGEIYKALYNHSYLDSDYSEKALSLLESSDFTSGLIAGLPQGMKAAHKYGFRNHQDGTYTLNDSAIIFANHPYVLCVMTKGRNIPVQEHDIAALSEQIYKINASN